MAVKAQRSQIKRFLAAVIVALGLSFAQPAISPGELFRVGQAQITATDEHRRAYDRDEPPMPTPDQQIVLPALVWTAPGIEPSIDIMAQARGDPQSAGSLEAAWHAGTLFGDLERPSA